MSDLYASFSFFDPYSADVVGERLRTELFTVHGISSKVFSEIDTVVVHVGGMLPVWGYASWWRWWTGLTDSTGLWHWKCAPIINTAASARLIAVRYTELIATCPQEVGRR